MRHDRPAHGSIIPKFPYGIRLWGFLLRDYSYRHAFNLSIAKNLITHSDQLIDAAILQADGLCSYTFSESKLKLLHLLLLVEHKYIYRHSVHIPRALLWP